MSSTYTDAGQALYDFMDALDISSIDEDGWGSKFNRPPKANELHYPAFAVVPLRDAQDIADSETDDDTVIYSVYLFFNYYEGTATEAEIRALVDLVRSAIRNERAKPDPLGGLAYGISFTGEWGGDETQSLRFYRLDVAIRVLEDLDP